MQRQRVSSSNLHSVGYDWGTATLEIKFHSGGIYRYARVPFERYRRLMRAASKGQHFHYHIKHRYPYWRVA